MYCEIKFTYWQIYGGGAATVPWLADLGQQGSASIVANPTTQDNSVSVQQKPSGVSN